MKKIHLPISVNYVSHWGFWEGMREILQNAIDTNDYSVDQDLSSNQITVTSRGGNLKLSTLMMGESSKGGDDSSIGKYGEGYKLAMLVLCRNNYTVTIDNGSELWEFGIEKNPELGCEGLCVSIFDSMNRDDGIVKVIVKGLSRMDFSEIDDKFIDKANIVIEAESYGSYCFNETVKRIYVGGLYVCDLPHNDEYWFSYNFAPNILELDRDRDAVNSFYLGSETTRLLYGSGNMSLLADMAASNAKDLSDYYENYSGGSYSSIEDQSEELAKLSLESFTKMYGISYL